MTRKLVWLFVWVNLLAALLFGQGLLAQVAITNTAVSVRGMTYYNFTVSVNGVNTTSGITWYVNDVTNGNSTIGTFSGFRYNAPNFPPTPNPVVIKAALTADLTQFGTASVTITNPVPSVASVSPWPLPAGSSTITVNGWGFVSGSVIRMNGVALFTTYVSSTRLTAPINFRKAPTSATSFDVLNPDPGSIASNVELVPAYSGSRSKVSDTAARRFLEQAAFGPDPYSLNRVKTLGFDAWIDEQVNEPVSTYPALSAISISNSPLQARFFTNAVHGRDQLRQRLAFALHKIWVVSASEINSPDKLLPYLRIFGSQAFGNYRTLMRSVTLNPAMGDYLDMRNNSKADPVRNTLANENYAREIMQLFTIGLYQLNADGTRKLDGSGNAIPTYNQADIMEFARVYTGWTYPTMPGAVAKKFNPAYYEGDMVAWQDNHDIGSKTLLNGVVLPANQLADKDLNDTLDNIFNHANVGPFVSKNLIQQLVTSNPSPAYVARIAAVFANNGLGVRGDLKAVVKAILLDSEARIGDGDITPNLGDGHLKEPALFLAQTLRGLNALVNDSNTLNSRSTALGENIFTPPTVFSYFSPNYVVGGTGGMIGPEFQIDTRSSAIERANQINTLIYSNYGAGATVDFTPWATLAATPSTLADQLGAIFLFGQMPTPYRTELVGAISGTTGTTLDKAKAALYVTLTSNYYSVKK